MHRFFLFALLPLVAMAALSSGCADVLIITARASLDFPGEGIIGSLAASIQLNSNQTVSRIAVDYPAALYPYTLSVASGVSAMIANLQAAVDACSDQKIVLLGYSEGGKFLLSSEEQA
jgi:hypothetical protein